MNKHLYAPKVSGLLDETKRVANASLFSIFLRSTSTQGIGRGHSGREHSKLWLIGDGDAEANFRDVCAVVGVTCDKIEVATKGNMSQQQQQQQQQRRPLSRVAVQRIQSSRVAAAEQRSSRLLRSSYRIPGAAVLVLLLTAGFYIALFPAVVSDDDDAELMVATQDNNNNKRVTPLRSVVEERRAAHPTHTVVRAVASDADMIGVLPFQPHHDKLIVTREKPTNTAAEVVVKTPIIISSSSSSSMTKTTTADARPWEGLPDWMIKYLEWHQYMRHIYPDGALINDPAAPAVLIHYCKSNSNSFGTRLFQLMGSLHDAVYVASKTNRVLLIQWISPAASLESFLEPAAVNWTVPSAAMERISTKGVVTASQLDGVVVVDTSTVNTNTPLFVFDWKNAMRTKSKNSLDHVKDRLASHRVILFDQDWDNVAEELRAASGERDFVGDGSEVFGILWRAFFKPTRDVQQTIDETMQALRLEQGKYAAVQMSNPGHVSPFVGADKERAVSTAIHAVQCSQWLTTRQRDRDPLQNKEQQQEPIYFLSDNSELVDYMTRDVAAANGPFSDTQSVAQNDLDAQLVAFQSMDITGRVVSRDVRRATRIDHQMSSTDDNEESVASLKATFVDLYLAVAARCVTFDSGSLASLATKISGTTCRIRHQDVSVQDETQSDKTLLCPI